jgi:hypothetical protein
MTELLTLEPRVAGTDVVEPSVHFAESVDVLHDRARCAWTSLCHYFATNECPQTGTPA